MKIEWHLTLCLNLILMTLSGWTEWKMKGKCFDQKQLPCFNNNRALRFAKMYCHDPQMCDSNRILCQIKFLPKGAAFLSEDFFTLTCPDNPAVAGLNPAADSSFCGNLPFIKWFTIRCWQGDELNEKTSFHCCSWLPQKVVFKCKMKRF